MLFVQSKNMQSLCQKGGFGYVSYDNTFNTVRYGTKLGFFLSHSPTGHYVILGWALMV